MTGRPVIAGVAMTPVRRNLEGTILDTAFEVVSAALEDAGIPREAVDALVVAPPRLMIPDLMFAPTLASYLQISSKNLSMVENGGSSSVTALHYAHDAIRLGRNRVAVVFAMDSRAFEPPAENLEFFLFGSVQRGICLYGPYDGLYLVAPMPFYAMSAQRYVHEHAVDPQDFAHAAVVLRSHAVKNPLAMFRKPITVAEVLASPVLSPPLHFLECSGFAAGAACAVVCDPDVARAARGPLVEIAGFGEYHDASHFIPNAAASSITRHASILRAASEAFGDAGLAPADVQVAEVLGVFAPTELMIYEDLGFFPKGKAGRAVRDGKTTHGGGGCVFNPSGGRLSLGYPPGAAPVEEIVEVVRHLRGEAGERQVRGAEVGLVHSEHGMMNGSVVLLLRRCR